MNMEQPLEQNIIPNEEQMEIVEEEEEEEETEQMDIVKPKTFKRLPNRTDYYGKTIGSSLQALDNTMNKIVNGEALDLILSHLKKNDIPIDQHIREYTIDFFRSTANQLKIDPNDLYGQTLSQEIKAKFMEYILFTNNYQDSQIYSNYISTNIDAIRSYVLSCGGYPSNIPRYPFYPYEITMYRYSSNTTKAKSHYETVQTKFPPSVDISYKVLELTDLFFDYFFRSLGVYYNHFYSKVQNYAFVYLEDNILQLSNDFCNEIDKSLFLNPTGSKGVFGAVSFPYSVDEGPTSINLHPIRAMTSSITNNRLGNQYGFHPNSLPVIVKLYAKLISPMAGLRVDNEGTNYGILHPELMIDQRFLLPCPNDNLDIKKHCNLHLNRTYPSLAFRDNEFRNERMPGSFHNARIRFHVQQLQQQKNLYMSLKDPIHEGIMGGMTSYLYDGGLCPYVLKYFGTYLCKVTDDVPMVRQPYAVMEAAQFEITHLLRREMNATTKKLEFNSNFNLQRDLMIWMTQFCWGIAKLKEYFGFLHMDCHLGNILLCYYSDRKIKVKDKKPTPLYYKVQDLSDIDFIVHHVSDSTYLVLEDNGLMVKIADYGLTYSNLSKSSMQYLKRPLIILNEEFESQRTHLFMPTMLSSLTNNLYFQTIDVNYFICSLWRFLLSIEDYKNHIVDPNSIVYVSGIIGRVIGYYKVKTTDFEEKYKHVRHNLQELQELLSILIPDLGQFSDLNPYILPPDGYLVKTKGVTEPYLYIHQDDVKVFNVDTKSDDVLSTDTFTFINIDPIFRIRDVGSTGIVPTVDGKIPQDHNFMLHRIVYYLRKKGRYIERDNKTYYYMTRKDMTPSEFKRLFEAKKNITLDIIVDRNNLKLNSLRHLDDVSYSPLWTYSPPVSSSVVDHYFGRLWKEAKTKLPLVSYDRLACGGMKSYFKLDDSLKVFFLQIVPSIAKYNLKYQSYQFDTIYNTPPIGKYIELLDLHLIYIKKRGCHINLVTEDKMKGRPLWESAQMVLNRGQIGDFVLMSGTFFVVNANIQMIAPSRIEEAAKKHHTTKSEIQKVLLGNPIGFFYSKYVDMNLIIDVDFPEIYRGNLATILFYEDGSIDFENYKNFIERYQTYSYEIEVFQYVSEFTEKTWVKRHITQQSILKVNGIPVPKGLKDLKKLVRPDYIYAITGGPILVWDGKIIFDENILRLTLEHNNLPVSFSPSPNPNRNYQAYTYKSPILRSEGEDLLPNDYLDVSGLYGQRHGGLLSPQNIVCLTNGGDILFIMVEGRGYRTPGLDRVTLAKMVQKYDIDRAVCFDGGFTANGVYCKDGVLRYMMQDPEHRISGPKILVYAREGGDKFVEHCLG